MVRPHVPAAPPIARNLTTLFGVVRYWRTYMREVAPFKRRGFYPLDLSLGLTRDRFSWNVLVQAARLATKLSYATAREVLGELVPNAPSTEVIEQTMLGLGAHAEAWFELQPAPEDDGEVLVIEIDGKCVPTATEDRELLRRRRKRAHRPKSGSPRHRGREKRARHPKQPRRKKGDKSKNGKMVTMVVMYTLRRNGRRLDGPINRRHYASFASQASWVRGRSARGEQARLHAREPAPRSRSSPTATTTRLTYAERLLPEAIHTIDVYHVIEKLWRRASAS